MAYIVEMFNGRSNRMEIMGLNEDKDLYVEKVIIEGEPTPDFREFSCSRDNWNKALELGRKMGWIPTGSVFEKTLDMPEPELSDYEPSSWGDDDLKIFSDKDAAALANALYKAIELMEDFQLKEYGNDSTIILTSTMNENEYKHLNRNLTKEFLFDFVTFLRKGKFNFVWDD